LTNLCRRRVIPAPDDAGEVRVLGVEWFGSLATDLIASSLFLAGGFVVGRYRERQRLKGRALHEYDFYPYGATPENFAEFSAKDFRLGMHHFLRNSDPRAARQLIFIGEQNNVKALLNSADLRTYERLVAKYHGAAIADDAKDFLENYRNIARLIGRTFPNMGIEILVHDLSNPSHSITTIESGEVTGRVVGMGTTKLLVDLMRRVNLGQDKLNYELDIGARRFKCTTIPIVRKDFGVVGAVCINIDINYIGDEVLPSAMRIADFLNNYCRTDMKLDENILSRDEYAKAVAGKRHFRDFAAVTST
jgi:predicted transcriptional regulator YheO